MIQNQTRTEADGSAKRKVAEQLAVSLGPEQIQAATELHNKLETWATTDRALTKLAQLLPGFGPEESLIKAVAINALYGTNVMAITRMAAHISTTMSNTALIDAGPELVEELARLENPSLGSRLRRHVSFASKFAHFFVDEKRFPILDRYAAKMIRYHLGRTRRRDDESRSYKAYVEDFNKVMRLAKWTGSARQLDHYLWISGQYRAWRKNKNVRINTELRKLFESKQGNARKRLLTMIGHANA
jgi:hypothetical protein